MTRVQALALATFVLALGAGALWPLPPPPPAPAEEDAWRPLPAEAASVPARPGRAEEARWVTGAPAEDAEGAEPWRLVGVTRRGEPVALFLDPEGRQVRRIGVGDALPDGARAVAIDGDGVTLERDGCRSELALHRERRSNARGDCATE